MIEFFLELRVIDLFPTFRFTTHQQQASVAADTAVSAKEKELLAKLEASKAEEAAATQAYNDAKAAGADAAELKKLQKVVKKAQKGVSFAQKGLKKLKKPTFNAAGTNKKKANKKQHDNIITKQ